MNSVRTQLAYGSIFVIGWIAVVSQGFGGPDEERAFIETHLQDARTIAQETGYPLSIMLAQAAVETGYGKTTLAREAKNFFGIKYFPEFEDFEDGTFAICKGTPVQHRDDEINARGKLIPSDFCRFTDFRASAQAMANWVYFFGYYKENYREAIRQRMNAEKFLREVSKTYATDPNYFEKVWNVILDHKLSRLDHVGEQPKLRPKYKKRIVELDTHKGGRLKELPEAHKERRHR